MKKFLSFFMALAMCISFLCIVACKKPDDTSGDTSEYPTLEQSEFAGTKIEFMHFWQDADAAIRKMAEYFEEGTGITVEVTLSPVASHLTSLNTKMQTNTMPALYTMWPGPTMPGYVDSGWVMDLTDYEGEWMDRMSSDAYNSCTTYDKLYIAPVNMSFMGIAYNKEVFERNNIEPPKNMEDFERIMDVLKEDTNLSFPMIWGNDCAVNMIYLMALSTLYQEYPDFDEKVTAGEMQFKDDILVDVYERLFIDWVEAGYYNSETCATYDRMSKAAAQFVLGKTAMMRLGGWDLTIIDQLAEESGGEIEYGMFPIPGIDNDGSVLAAAGEAVAVNAKLSDAEKGAALEFLDFFLSAPVNAEMCGIVNSLSPYSGVEVEAKDCIKELNTYLDDTSRGWTNWPMDVQSKMGECLDIVTEKGGRDAKMRVLNDHLDYLASLWK